MGTKIINNTDLCFKELGEIIDSIQFDYPADTSYYGKRKLMRIKYKGKKIEINIKIMCYYVEWKFDFYED